MEFEELRNKITEINEEMNMDGAYAVLLAVDICERLECEFDMKITDELFEDICYNVDNSNVWTSDEFIESSYIISREYAPIEEE